MSLTVACAGPASIPVPPALEALDPIVQEHLKAHLELARSDPSQEHLRELALAYLANSFPAEAETLFDRLAGLTPDEPLPVYYQSRAQTQLGEHDEAFNTLRRVADGWPGFSPARERLAEAVLARGELDEAEALYREVIASSPNEPVGYLGLVEVHLQRGEPEMALEALARVRPENAALPQKKLLRGRSLRALGRLEEARPLIESARGAAPLHLRDDWSVRLELHVRDLPRLVDRATGLLESGQARGAIQLLEEIRGYHPDSYEVAVNLAVAYMRGGRANDGLRLVTEAIADNGERFEGYLNLAAIHLEMGELDGALSAAREAASLAPGVAQAHRTLAKVHERRGEPNQAAEAYAAAVRLQPYDAILQVELAKAAIRAGAPELAEEACREISALEPESITGPLCLGEALRRQGRTAEAREALAAARAMEPNHPDVAKLAARMES